ncbi:hypothetical protein [Paenibacillus planticolens]|nr:hypothetical protein [Paenibacillus planticolens]
MLQWIVAESEQLKEDGVWFLCRYATKVLQVSWLGAAIRFRS